jgi:hypothetical protein
LQSLNQIEHITSMGPEPKGDLEGPPGEPIAKPRSTIAENKSPGCQAPKGSGKLFTETARRAASVAINPQIIE